MLVGSLFEHTVHFVDELCKPHQALHISMFKKPAFKAKIATEPTLSHSTNKAWFSEPK